MFEIAHTRQMEQAIKRAHAERGAAFSRFWTSLLSARGKFSLKSKPQVTPAG